MSVGGVRVSGGAWVLDDEVVDKMRSCGGGERWKNKKMKFLSIRVFLVNLE